jgi:hypothetical protein
MVIVAYPRLTDPSGFICAGRATLVRSKSAVVGARCATAFVPPGAEAHGSGSCRCAFGRVKSRSRLVVRDKLVIVRCTTLAFDDTASPRARTRSAASVGAHRLMRRGDPARDAPPAGAEFMASRSGWSPRQAGSPARTLTLLGR